MTDDEKTQERKCKDNVCEKLAGISVKAYALGQIDLRLDTYANALINNFDAHNLYELLALDRFFYFLDRYEMRISEVKKFIQFYEFLKFDGVNGRQSYELTPVQTFQFSNILGFYKDEQHRLCRDACLYVPRKYSKTTSVTSIADYDLLCGDANAQVYCGANTYDQAKIAFDEIRKTLRGLDPSLKHFQLNREMVRWKDNPDRDSFVRCLSNNADKLDGLNASTVIMDEYAQADSADLYNVLVTSMGIRENPLVITITTASDKPDAPFAQKLEYYKNVLKGNVKADAVFAHLFMPDVDDDESDRATWYKVQPHMGITVKESFYEQMYEKAQSSRADMKAFRTKLLNVYETGDELTWITGEEIRKHFRKIDIDRLGYPADCEVAVDLSVDNDFSAVSYYVYLYNEKTSHIHTEFYFPEGSLNGHPNEELYRRWAKEGHLKLCKGNIIDYNQIVMDILSHGKNLRILQIGYDPNRAQDFQNLLIASGARDYMYQYKQTNYYYTIPVQAIPRMLDQGVLTFSPNPIEAYCFDNAVLDVDRMQNYRPMKREANHKIDGCITATMAVGMSLKQVRT
jgi:phage terminase large subunit-like protein